jgi:hypothetical protein
MMAAWSRPIAKRADLAPRNGAGRPEQGAAGCTGDGESKSCNRSKTELMEKACECRALEKTP